MSAARPQRGGHRGGGWAAMMPASPLLRDQSGSSGKPPPSPSLSISPSPSPLPSCSGDASSPAMSSAGPQRAGGRGGGWAATTPVSPLLGDQSGSSGKPLPSPSPSCSANVSPHAMFCARPQRGGDRGGGWGAAMPVSPLLRDQSGSFGKPSSSHSPTLSPSPSPLSSRDVPDCHNPELQFRTSLQIGAGASAGLSLSGSHKDESNGGGWNGNRPFDLFLRPSPKAAPSLQPSLFAKNKARKAEEEKARSGPRFQKLRPGMVLLRNFLGHDIQVDILRQCRDLGFGPGGFYQPGYRDGAKLSLHMMCLGKNWDPETRRYEDTRSYDAAVPPRIPETFKKLVAEAMQTAHDLMTKKGKRSGEQELPGLEPDLCIVNFYTTTGKLGLHQDRDESEDSLRRGFPVVSFSIGDSACFEYGDSRTDKPVTIELESGDVLIFGGKSRHIFHGVTEIKSNTAPERLIEETRLRPGRLNLTFRQY